MRDTIYREDAIAALWDMTTEDCPNPGAAVGKCMEVIRHLPSADNEVIGKLKTAIENEEICKNCPTAERISGENLLGAMALGFSYGMGANEPQGEWERIPYSFVGGYRCSICGRKSLENHYNFCPHCGARMKGAEDEVLRQL